MRVDGVWWWRQRLILPVASHPVISAQLALGVIAPSQGAGKWLALCVSQDRGQPGFLSGSLHLTWLCCVSWMVPRIGQAWGHLIAQMTPMGGGAVSCLDLPWGAHKHSPAPETHPHPCMGLSYLQPVLFPPLEKPWSEGIPVEHLSLSIQPGDSCGELESEHSVKGFLEPKHSSCWPWTKCFQKSSLALLLPHWPTGRGSQVSARRGRTPHRS